MSRLKFNTLLGFNMKKKQPEPPPYQPKTITFDEAWASCVYLFEKQEVQFQNRKAVFLSKFAKWPADALVWQGQNMLSACAEHDVVYEIKRTLAQAAQAACNVKLPSIEGDWKPETGDDTRQPPAHSYDMLALALVTRLEHVVTRYTEDVMSRARFLPSSSSSISNLNDLECAAAKASVLDKLGGIVPALIYYLKRVYEPS